jgi:hypothetical protein
VEDYSAVSKGQPWYRHGPKTETTDTKDKKGHPAEGKGDKDKGKGKGKGRNKGDAPDPKQPWEELTFRDMCEGDVDDEMTGDPASEPLQNSKRRRGGF